MSDPSWQDDSLFTHDLASTPIPEIGTVLVTGASGYIGGRLVPELLSRGYRVRVLVRSPSPECEKQWPETEVVVGDALREGSLDKALNGVHTLYYLIHSLVRGPKEFEAADLKAARLFREAAQKAGVKRIIYLGGLGAGEKNLSDHLRSRLEVAKELRKGRVPVTSLHAGVIIGSGSASYEIILNLVRNLPVVFIPVWAHKNRCQPIAVRDVIKYLVGVLEKPETSGLALDIGGPDVITYENMLRVLSDILKKKKLFIPSPVTHIGFYSYVASLITPVPAPITLCLVEGMKSDALCRNDDIRKFLPIETLPYRESLVRAMSREMLDRVHTRWSDAYPPAHELAMKLHQLQTPPKYRSAYSLLTDKDQSRLFKAYCRVGGKEGWFQNNWMWRLRGAMDRLFFGVGTARGRRSTSTLKVNDVIDFWRVEDIVENRRLLLRAEMKVPGKAWLEFTSEKEGNRTKLSITAHYDTKGFFGNLYWYIFLPFHYSIFHNLLKQIERRG